jgi:uncharacterized protein YlxW (UPF0749 family)
VAKNTAWRVLVPVVAAVAGFLFTTNAHTAAGTSLRDDRRPELSGLISDRTRELRDESDEATRLRGEIDQITAAEAGSDQRIAAQRARADGTRPAAGLTALHGPGLAVSLNDAPRRPDGTLPANATADDVVVHQQDVQSVVNALWAGGAEAMTIEGVRVISTSAVRCVGNTLLLHDRVYSPPFDIEAIGNPQALRAALDASRGVQAFRDAAASFGLGYTVATRTDIVAPAYSDSVSLAFATAGG